MDLSPLFYFLLFFAFTLFGPIKSKAFFCIEDGKFLGWEDFFPRVNKEIHCGVFGHVGFFSGNLVFSYVVDLAGIEG